MANAAINRLNYHFSSGQDEAGMVESYYVPYTVDMGLAHGTTVFISVPPSETEMTDGSACYMKVGFTIRDPDGHPIKSDYFPTLENTKMKDVIFGITNGGFSNFWSSINLSLNGFPLPPVTEAPYTGYMVDAMGSGLGYKRNFLEGPSGHATFVSRTSKVGEFTYVPETVGSRALMYGNASYLYGRLASDFMLTCSQFIPNNVRMDFTLMRQQDAFVVGSELDEPKFRLQIREVTLFVKRVRLNAAGMNMVNSSLATRGLLKYQRLSTQSMPVSKGSLFRWSNIWSSSLLPTRIFFGLVNQEAYQGSLKREPMFFDTAHVRNARVAVNGRDVLPEPYSPRLQYKTENAEEVDVSNSSALEPVMGLNRALGLLTDRNATQGITQKEWLAGAAIYAVEMPNCGSATKTMGTVDIAIEFKQAPTTQYVCIAMAEFEQALEVRGPERSFNIATDY